MSTERIKIEQEDVCAPCSCGSCDWHGLGAEVNEAEGAYLSAGDPSPVGRCPKCDALAYLDRPEDRARDAAMDLLAAVKELLATQSASSPPPPGHRGGPHGEAHITAYHARRDAARRNAEALIAKVEGPT